MVRTDQMWRYINTVKIGHYHGDGNYTDETWETVVKVEPSQAQGWDFHLEDGCKLQSCFDETEIEVQVIWHEDVANWGMLDICCLCGHFHDSGPCLQSPNGDYLRSCEQPA